MFLSAKLSKEKTGIGAMTFECNVAHVWHCSWSLHLKLYFKNKISRTQGISRFLPTSASMTDLSKKSLLCHLKYSEDRLIGPLLTGTVHLFQIRVISLDTDTLHWQESNKRADGDGSTRIFRTFWPVDFKTHGQSHLGGTSGSTKWWRVTLRRALEII